MDIIRSQYASPKEMDSSSIFCSSFANSGDDKNHNCWFDNLYLSENFANASFSQRKTSSNFGTYMEEWMRAAKMCSSREEDITI